MTRKDKNTIPHNKYMYRNIKQVECTVTMVMVIIQYNYITISSIIGSIWSCNDSGYSSDNQTVALIPCTLLYTCAFLPIARGITVSVMYIFKMGNNYTTLSLSLSLSLLPSYFLDSVGDVKYSLILSVAVVSSVTAPPPDRNPLAAGNDDSTSSSSCVIPRKSCKGLADAPGGGEREKERERKNY